MNSRFRERRAVPIRLDRARLDIRERCNQIIGRARHVRCREDLASISSDEHELLIPEGPDREGAVVKGAMVFAAQENQVVECC